MSQTPEEMLRAAFGCFRAQDYGGAERLCREIMGREPRNADALHLLGVLRMQGGDAREAITLIGRALEIKPRDAAIVENLGLAFLAAQDYAAAEQQFRRALALGAAHGLLHMRLGLALASRGRLPEAEHALRTAVAQAPDDPEIHLNLGNVLAGLGRTEEAIDCLRAALARAPHHADAHYNMGALLQHLGRFEAARDAYRSALALVPSHADALNNLGIVCEQMGQIEEAVACYRRILETDPHHVHALSNLGKALRTQGRLDEAEQYCERALAVRGDFADALLNLGNIRVEQGLFESARELYERAQAADPHNADTHLSCGMLCLSLGDFGQGWTDYEWRPTRMQARQAQVDLDTSLPAEPAGRVLLLVGEQGLGDELFFLRFAPELKERGARLICQCDPRLGNLIGRTGFFERVVSHGESVPGYDRRLLMGDLPLALLKAGRPAHRLQPAGRAAPPLPLRVLDARSALMQARLARLGAPPYIGLTWRAGTPLAEQQGRRDRALCKEVPLAALARALKGVPGTVLVLQRQPRAEEFEILRGTLERDAHDLSDANADLEDMLALLSLLGEYVGVSNTNMHLVAGLGCTARVLVPHPAEWRWMARGDASPWFPGFALYRQPVEGDWTTALARLTDDLLRSPALSGGPR